jgi:hypothetical protein
MEFMNRSAKPTQVQATPEPTVATPILKTPSTPPKKHSKLSSLSLLGVLVPATLLIALAIVTLIISDNPIKKVAFKNLYNKDSYQVLFLDSGAVYVGKLQEVSEQLVQIKDVYFLDVKKDALDTTTQNANLSLGKLGCEIYGLDDALIINKAKIISWSDIDTKAASNSRVLGAINDYKAKYANGGCPPAVQTTPATTTPAQPTTPTATPTPAVPVKKP